MMRRLIALALATLTAPAVAAPQLAPVWTDHAVIQQNAPIAIAGTATPGERVIGQLGNESAATAAGPDGRFALRFAPREASMAPLSLTVTDAEGGVIRRSDLLVGDVYLCSGQSNMELAVERALDRDNQLRMAPDEGLRLLTIPRDTAAVPQTSFGAPVRWMAADAASVEPFSAACYYMAKALRRDLGIPIGAIHASWGGSAASAWLAPQQVQARYGTDAAAQLQLYARDPRAAALAFAPTWYRWWQDKDGGRKPWEKPDTLDWKPVPKISFWNDWKGTPLAQNAVANVWLAQTLTLTAAQARAGGTLSIGAIDDLDMTWVNSQPVGYTFGWGAERHYAVPAAQLHAGDNRVLIAANNMWDAGGFYGGPDRLFFMPTGGAPIPLGTGWRYALSDVQGTPPRAPWDANAGLGVMHNRMIAPLGEIALAGVAWYQGEADVGQPAYDAKLALLFAGWRAQFGAATRMLVVQLANFGAPAAAPTASGWAQLRDEQRRAVMADDNAALVTAIDIGEATDIHPANKNLLGARLAMAAQRQAMPMPIDAVDDGVTVTVRFDGIAGALAAWSGTHPLGVELCADDQASCRFVDATIAGDRLAIPTDGQPATRVRYAWADSPVVNLYDARAVPVPGFALPISQR